MNEFKIIINCNPDGKSFLKAVNEKGDRINIDVNIVRNILNSHVRRIENDLVVGQVLQILGQKNFRENLNRELKRKIIHNLKG